MSETRTVLILGGTGFVGRALCAHLARSAAEDALRPAWRLRVPTRHRHRAQALLSMPLVDVLEADVHAEADLERLVEGCSAVVNLVAILHGKASAFEAVHVELPTRLARVCQRAGVRRMVHVSALGAGAQAPSMYLRSKTQGEEVLRASGLDVSLLRPSVIFGREDSFLNLFARLQALAPFVPLAGARARFQPVWVNDVAAALAACLDRPQTIGSTIECAGPDIYTLAELVRLAGVAAGHPRPIVALPEGIARMQAWLMEQGPGDPLMSRDNLDSMRVANVASGAGPGLASLGIIATPLQAVLPSMFGVQQGSQRLESWRSRRL